MDGSTIDAASAQQISKQIKAAGAQYLEAPVSGPVFHKNSKRKNRRIIRKEGPVASPSAAIHGLLALQEPLAGQGCLHLKSQCPQSQSRLETNQKDCCGRCSGPPATHTLNVWAMRLFCVQLPGSECQSHLALQITAKY